MSLKKYIFVLLCLLLCFSAVSEQVNNVFDHNLLSLDEGSVDKVDNDADQNELAILLNTQNFQPSKVFIRHILTDEAYRQPDAVPLLRPPIIQISY